MLFIVLNILRETLILDICCASSCNRCLFFFYRNICAYITGVVVGSYQYPRAPLWYTGIIIFFVMIITAFLGYLLPWGQMSFWGGTVITNLVTILPYGDTIVEFLWGGFSVANPTLNKFYSLHFIMPFILIILVISHLFFLHKKGSNNALGITSNMDKIFFSPYYLWKDLFSSIVFFTVFFFITFFHPNFLTDPDNYIEANPLVTPPHIVPEWYFLPFYAILRGIPNKTLGVLALLSSIFLLGMLPVIHKSIIRLLDFKFPVYIISLIAVLSFMFLFILGAAPIHQPFICITQICIVIYFSFFFFLSVIEVIFFLILPLIIKKTDIRLKKLIVVAIVVALVATTIATIRRLITRK